MVDPALQFTVERLLARYAAAIDGGRLEEWPLFFTESCRYHITTRESHERGLPYRVGCRISDLYVRVLESHNERKARSVNNMNDPTSTNHRQSVLNGLVFRGPEREARWWCSSLPWVFKDSGGMRKG